MRVLPAQVNSRREFIRSAARYGLLGILGAAGAILGLRQLGQRCVNGGICRDCAKLAGCGLPQALSAKQAQAGS